jgi:glycosyltransferase involved in cell wall biosynthesis
MSAAAQLRRVAEKVGLPVSRFLVEKLLLARMSVLQRIARRVMAQPLRDIDARLDRDFYLRQVKLPGSRAPAERDPSLHYALVGRFRSYAPSPDFDPIFYRAQHADLAWAGDPLHHHVRRGNGHAMPTNEVAALAPLAPAAGIAEAGVVMTMHHSRGGGSSRYLALYEQKLAGQGHRIVRLSRVSRVQPLFRAFDRGSGVPLGAAFDLLEDAEQFRAQCRTLGVTRLVVNHVVDLPPVALSIIPDVCRDAGIKFDVILHDYFLVCPRINMVDDRGFCGEPQVAQCRSCVQRNGSELAGVDPLAWRKAARAFVAAADRLWAPSDDAAGRLSRQWDLPVSVWQPEDDAMLKPPVAPSVGSGEPLKVVIVGALNAAKGFHVLRRLAHQAQQRGAPVRFVLLGQSIDDAELRRHGVDVRGRYRESEIDAMLQAAAPHIALLPAIWPETWSFIATIAMRHRLPLYAFDIGAVTQRLRRLDANTVLPLELAEQPDALLDRLLAIRDDAIRSAQHAGGRP